ncbi:hypothetical protein GCM10020369_62560 [Cryptosporangium minutisporangium]|uniref:Uncharacterized protein n=1 Tax=Cryptosporangium minutisporangium TaxID=113569 RepID=A0ABP6T7W7_9ACTN
MVAVLTVVVLAVCGLVTIFAVSGGNDDEAPSSSTPAASESVASAPSRNAQQRAGNLPELKQELQVVVVGAVFASGEQTRTEQRAGWPFAFRVPVGWMCDGAQVVDGKNSDGAVCRPPGRAGTLVEIGVRECDAPCDGAEQTLLTNDVPGPLTRGDATTSYHESADAKYNEYRLVMSHFFGDGRGEPLRWQVVVVGTSPPSEQAELQKVTNDIRTQTP